MAKHLTHILIGILLMTVTFGMLSSCNSDNDIIDPADRVMQDGTWEGTGEGRGGTILVRIKVENDIIS